MMNHAIRQPLRFLWHIARSLAAVACFVGLFHPLVATASSMASFVHTSTVENTSTFITEIDHPLLNDNPRARIFVTQAWNFLGGQGNQNNRAVGVRYDVDYANNGRWSIFNEDDTYDMEPGLVFFVMVFGDDSISFLHLTNQDNITNIASNVNCPPEFDYVCFSISSDILHGHTLDAVGLRGATFPVPSSLIRSGTSLLLRAESTDNTYYPNMRPGALFWIFAGGEEFGGELSFTHVATADNTVDWATKLDDPRLNGNPDSVFIVTRSGPSGPTQEENIGVVYANDGVDDIWSIMHQTTAPIPEGALFSVFIPPILADGFESGDLSWWN